MVHSCNQINFNSDISQTILVHRFTAFEGGGGCESFVNVRNLKDKYKKIYALWQILHEN